MEASITVSRGVLSLMAGANKSNDSVQFLLDGDLSQMSAQERFLRDQGMKVGRTDVYPGLYTEEDFKKSLNLIWNNKIEGWWNYDSKYIEHGICTQEEFDSALDA